MIRLNSLKKQLFKTYQNFKQSIMLLITFDPSVFRCLCDRDLLFVNRTMRRLEG